MDVVIRLGVRIEMHWPLFSIGTLQLNSSRLHFDFIVLTLRSSFFHMTRNDLAVGVGVM